METKEKKYYFVDFALLKLSRLRGVIFVNSSEEKYLN
jgi:hypothetical protein